MKNLLITVLMWPVGMMVGVISITPIVIITQFALPTCRELLDMGDMMSRSSIFRYRRLLVFELVILVAASAAVFAWTGWPANVGFFTGLVLMGLYSLGAASPRHHRNNMMEFLKFNRANLSLGFLAKADAWSSSGGTDTRLC